MAEFKPKPYKKGKNNLAINFIVIRQKKRG